MTEIGKLHDFWVEKIKALQTQKLVSSFLLNDSGWEWKMNYKKPYYSEIDNYGQQIACEVYDKATDNITPTPTNLTELLLDLPANDEGKSAIAEYAEIIRENLIYWGVECEKARKEKNFLQEVYLDRLIKTVLRYEFNVGDLPSKEGMENDNRSYFHHLKNNVLKKRSLGKILKSERRLTKRIENRENQIRRACDLNATATIPNDWENFVHTILDFAVNTLGVNDPDNLPTIPVGEDLTSLLARPTQSELDTANAWIDGLEKGFREILEMNPADTLPDNYGDLANLYNANSGNQTVIQLKNQVDNLQNWKDNHNCLAGHTCTATPCPLAHCPPTHANYNTIKGESDHYQRIHTKLNGKVSDSELQVLLDAVPNCSHSDYDTIKQERDQLKTEQQTQEQVKQQAIQAKETEIINKIITDLQLSTERERERTF